MGCKTLLLTLNLDRIAWQPCNPAVGGPAKSQLVHEVDAMGGEIGKMADRCYLQKRVLNRSKVCGAGGQGQQQQQWQELSQQPGACSPRAGGCVGSRRIHSKRWRNSSCSVVAVAAAVAQLSAAQCFGWTGLSPTPASCA